MITSRENPLIKLCRRLQSGARARREEGLFVAEGARLCREALRAGVAVQTLLATPEAAEKNPWLREAGVPAFLSYSAGTFVCNDILYSLLHLIARERPAMKGGFIHVPYATEQTVDKPSGTPGMELGTIARALERAIGAVVEAMAEGLAEKCDK